MKIRRYLGSNTQEAILKVKMDLGNNALILNTRKVRQKGLFKVFAKPMVEVLAAIDDYYDTRREQEDKSQVSEKDMKDNKISVEKEGKTSSLEKKVNSMQTMLQKIYEQMLETEEKAEDAKKDVSQNELPKVFKFFFDSLIKNEVEAGLARRLVNTAIGKAGGNASAGNAASVLYNTLTGLLGKPETIEIRNEGKPTVAIFVGPTGVGKTTTLAKIAADFTLNSKKSVALITADTYRIAAVEQLKIYAEILGIPITVIYSPDEIQDAVNEFNNKDLVLIDTAGRSFKDKLQFDELKTLVSAASADEVYLVLSTVTSMQNCVEILKNYNFLKDYKLIFTKIDEAPAAGIILNVKCLTSKSLSYITNGQNVPDDIEVANIGKLATNLLGSINK